MNIMRTCLEGSKETLAMVQQSSEGGLPEGMQVASEVVTLLSEVQEKMIILIANETTCDVVKQGQNIPDLFGPESIMKPTCEVEVSATEPATFDFGASPLSEEWTYHLRKTFCESSKVHIWDVKKQ